MTKEDLAEGFLKINLHDELKYVIGVEVDYTKCLRDNKDPEMVKDKILYIISKLINLKSMYEFYNEE